LRPTRAEINLKLLNNNIDKIKSYLDPNTALMTVVKANAYGHGIIDIGKKALKSGARSLGVAIPEEGAQLREAGIACDILVLGSISPNQIELVLDYNLSVCIFSHDIAELLNQRAKEKNKNIKVHIKIDSGMGRIGVRDSDEALSLCFAIKDMKNLILEGVFTHFACADECGSKYSLIQLERFKSILADIGKKGVYTKWVHASNTASIINYPQAHFNMVRAGIGIYGYGPDSGSKENLTLEPILSWHTEVSYLKEIEEGCSVSYGRTFVAKGARIVATLPVGYGDGYSRLLSNRGWVLIRGEKAPIIGNICMDQMMVDVTGIPEVRVGDHVVLIGRQGNEAIFADDIAKLCGTISYEVLTNINNRVPRIYVEDKDDSYK